MHIIPDIIAISIIYSLFYKYYLKDKDENTIKLYSLMYLYIAFVLYVTLMPIIYNLPNILLSAERSFNTDAFIDYRLEYGDYNIQIILNIIMMVPFGILYPKITNKNICYSVFYSFIFSAIIETCQYLFIFNRTSDITDLITNTIGGLIGYCIYYLYKKLKSRI